MKKTTSLQMKSQQLWPKQMLLWHWPFLINSRGTGCSSNRPEIILPPHTLIN